VRHPHPFPPPSRGRKKEGVKGDLMSTRRKIFILLTLLLILPITTIFAKDAKIGFVDSDRIFKEYQATAAANLEFNDFVDTYRDSAANLRQKIEQFKTELESQKLVLSEEARLRKLDEIESTTQKYNYFLQDVFGSGGKVEQKNDELMAPLLKKINDAVAKIAQQEAFAVVLDLSEGVFYAGNELDITDMVIKELNLEYGPQTLPTGEVKKIIAIFPFREENTEAADGHLGQRCQDELYKIISGFSQFKFISKTNINMEIVRKGYGTNLEDNQAYNISHTLLCDYLIIGSVSKFATKIEYTISLKDVKATKEINKKKSTVTEEIKLSEFLNNDFRALIDKIQQ
jgi:outer membrane protein